MHQKSCGAWVGAGHKAGCGSGSETGARSTDGSKCSVGRHPHGVPPLLSFFILFFGLPQLVQATALLLSLAARLFKVCAVNQALMSVRQMTKKGNRVVFDNAGSYIEDKVSGAKTWMHDE